MAALSVASNPSSAAVPALLLVATVPIAVAFQAGGSAAVPAAVATLTKGVGQAMFMTKLRCVLATVALVGATVGGTAIWALGAPGQDTAAPPPKAVQAPPPLVPAQPIPRDGPVPPTAPIAQNENLSAAVRTDNFIVRAPSRRIAQLVGETAERMRKSEAVRWLGKELPAWPEPCTIYVTLGGNGAGGATTFQFNDAQVLDRKMFLNGALDQLLCNALPHEITHTVLADYFRARSPAGPTREPRCWRRTRRSNSAIRHAYGDSWPSQIASSR